MHISYISLKVFQQVLLFRNRSDFVLGLISPPDIIVTLQQKFCYLDSFPTRDFLPLTSFLTREGLKKRIVNADHFPFQNLKAEKFVQSANVVFMRQ